LKKKIIVFILTIIIASIFFSFYLLLKQENIKLVVKTNNLIALQRLTDVTDILQKELNRSFEYTEFLDLMVRSNPEKVTDNFNTYGELILERNQIISNVQLAPEAIVQYIYPMKGNESAVGHNLLTDSRRNASVKKAIDEKISISQGPVKSLQGDTLVFNRKPIYIENEFWGMAIVTIKFTELMKQCGISEDGRYYSYSIRATKTDGVNDFEWGDSKIVNLDSIKKTIELPGQEWEIYIYPKEGWGNAWTSLNVYDYFSFLSVFVISILSYFHINNYMTSTEKAKLDPLTHTLNISTFQKLTKRKIKQKNKKHALIIMDLNDFKQINDNYGHPIGDAVIIEASNRLNRVITGNDSLSRMGGDEFVILLCDVENEEQVRKIARRIVASIQKPMSFDNLVINVAISVGYALYPIEGETYDLLYQVADERMYNCKHKNKNNIPCFEK